MQREPDYRATFSIFTDIESLGLDNEKTTSRTWVILWPDCLARKMQLIE